MTSLNLVSELGFRAKKSHVEVLNVEYSITLL